jgi:hypothetical protein
MAQKQPTRPGRPPKGASKMPRTVPVRVSSKLWKELDAARRRRGSLYMAEEIRERLEHSVILNVRLDIWALTDRIGELVKRVGRVTKKDWREDAFTSAAMRYGVEMLLCHYGAKGTPTVPPAIENLATRFPNEYGHKFRTPTELGGVEAGRMIAELEIEALSDLDPKEARDLLKNIPGARIDPRRIKILNS